jgi:hypothetical protein
MAGMSPGLAAFKLAFELSPIVLTGGITNTFPGFALPIMAITESANFPFSLLSGGGDLSLDKFFAHYQVLPGSSLIQQDLAKYPFANAQIAGNAVISQPVTVSVLMICPIQNELGWAEKLAIISGLKWLLDQHNLLGGTYTILTPAYVYQNCIMRGMHDASSQLTKQVQNTYQFDFEKPLLTLSDAASLLNSVANVIQNATGAVNDVFGLGVTSPTSVVLPSVMPGTAAQTAAQVAGPGFYNPFAQPPS